METNKIYHWDCLEVMRTFPDKSVDLVLTDPPYEFISKKPTGGGIYKQENKKHLESIDISFGMSFSPERFLQEIKRILKKFNAFIRTNKSLLTKYINFAEENWYKRDILIWIKDNPIPAFNWKFMNDKEYCVFIKESWSTFNTIPWWYSKYFTWYKDSIWNWEFNHPTVKPLHIIKNQLDITSQPWDIVLDPFLWSWTTAVACEQLWRKYIGIEKEKKYVDIANKRLENIEHPLF